MHTGVVDENGENKHAISDEPVRTAPDPSGPVRDESQLISELRDRINGLNDEVDFYREELRDRRLTTAALADVIEAFRLTAQTNSQRAERESEHSAQQTHMFDGGDIANTPQSRLCCSPSGYNNLTQLGRSLR